MKAELIAIGSELLRFGRRDSNGDWLAERLQRHGVEVMQRTLIGDDLDLIVDALTRAIDHAGLVLLTGGLGPTEDDRTRDALAGATGCPLERDDDEVARLAKKFADRDLAFAPEQLKQADRPRGAEWIANDLGSAPGIAMTVGDTAVMALPGVPPEMKRMFERFVAPWLASRASGGLARRTLKVGGRYESSVDRQLSDLYGTDGVDVTILAGVEGIELQLTAVAPDADRARRSLDGVDRQLRQRLGDDLYGVDDDTLAAVVGRALSERGLTVATAESCTAGMLSAALTEVPGSSRWFRGGLVVYHDDLKQSLAGVPRELLERDGAVSESVARRLAEQVRQRAAADIGIGVTGIAGPDGGTEEKPVGLVHVALADAAGTEHWRIHTVGDRFLIRRRTVLFALDRLRRRLLAEATPA